MHPVPLDIGTLQALQGSALRLGIDAFLCHRLSYLRRPTTTPCEALVEDDTGLAKGPARTQE